MIVKVHEHLLEIQKSPVNELEVNVTKIQFVFDEVMDEYVKKAFFSNNDASIEILIENNECNIPVEVLNKTGQVRLGVIAYEVQDEQLIERYNPSPAYFMVSEGSMIEADNTEPITPTDKEQIEQALVQVQTEMNNLDIDAEKVEHTTTITITDKEGNTKEVQILDGEQGPQGEQGPAGSIKIIVVETLPTQDIDTSAIYLVPSQETESQNNYEEYVYINNQWEKLGEVPIATDLTDYVKFTDYATQQKAGVIKVDNNSYGLYQYDGFVIPATATYEQYNGKGNYYNISKGTLENVITGKGLVSNTNYATDSTGGVIRTNSNFGTGMSANGELNGAVKTVGQYNGLPNQLLISKGTLNNVLNDRIGNIQTLLDNLDTGAGV